MYAQYQQYGQNSTAVASQVWNGQAWAPSGGSYNGTHSSYTQQTSHPAQVSVTSSVASSSTAPTDAKPIPENPTIAYTEYYHGWQKNIKDQQAYLGRIPASSTALREEVQRRINWYQYYSDQSSRAAHHFHEHPNATEAPFELPPAPESMSAAAAASTTNNQGTSQKAHTNRATPANAAQENNEFTDASGSLKVFFQKSLDQCSSDAEKKTMQGLVERAIAKAIQDGVLATKNWNHEPMPRLPHWPQIKQPMAPTQHINLQPQAQVQTSYSSQIGNTDGHYGQPPSKPNRSWEQAKSKRNQQPVQHNRAANNNYYGSVDGGEASSSTMYSHNTPHGGLQHSSFDSSSLYSQQATGPATPNKKRNFKSFDDDFMAFEPTVSKKSKQQLKKKQTKKQQAKQSPQKKKVPNGLDRSTKALAKRAGRFAGPGGIADVSSSKDANVNYDRYMGKTMLGGNQKQNLDEADYEQMTVKGTCTVLEKSYLRLTAPPRAELVRPKPILERHLADLKDEYKKNKTQKRDYSWFCSQFKAARQDCTVQRIQDAFAVDVYETHAKIALEQGDLNEYNQCQTQLKELYNNDDIPDKKAALQNYEEFVAYRLLYYVFLSTNESYDGGSSDMLKIMLSLSSEQRKHPAIEHGLKVRTAVMESDYLAFFRLHSSVPNLGGFLTSRIVPAMRLRAMRRMCKAFRPTLQASHCLMSLGFTGDASAQEEGIAWIKRCGAVVEGDKWITKDSVIREPEEPVKNSLI